MLDSPPLPGSGLAETNLRFYESLWAKSELVGPERFNTWPLVTSLLPAPARLEVGAGLRPRLPLAGTHFVDLSPAAVTRLNQAGGIALRGELPRLAFADGHFDLVAAFDVIEHVSDDRQAFAELSRVLKVGGRLLFSVPLHGRLWTDFDDCVGHARRYEPAELTALLAANHLTVERSTGFGMMPRNGPLMRWGLYWLREHRERAMPWYNRIFMPLGIMFQKRLKFTSGLIPSDDLSEMILVCRRLAPA